MKVLARIVMPLFFAPAIALVPAGQASAETAISVPTMSIGVASVSDGIKVCFTGTSHVIGPWTAHIAGVRATATSPAQAPISFDFVNPGSTSVNECPTVAKYGSLTGQFEMTFEFLGGVAGATTDRPASLHGIAWWAPTQPDGWFVTTGG